MPFSQSMASLGDWGENQALSRWWLRIHLPVSQSRLSATNSWSTCESGGRIFCKTTNERRFLSSDTAFSKCWFAISRACWASASVTILALLSTSCLWRARLLRRYPSCVRKVFQEEWKRCFHAIDSILAHSSAQFYVFNGGGFSLR